MIIHPLMSKRLTIFTLCSMLLGLGLGFSGGFSFGNRSEKIFERRALINGAVDRADVLVRALGSMRRGDTNTLNFLENSLDSAIAEIGEYLDATPKSEWASADTQMLEIAAKYRSENPHAVENKNRQE